MDKKDLKLIVTLEAQGTTAEKAWNKLQNQNRCLPAFEFVVNISNRKNISAVDQFVSQIQLIFDDKSKNFEKNFVFENDSRICDIFLNERNVEFNDQQFCITFNEQEKVIFKNKSRKKIQINYNNEAPHFWSQFIWILFDTYQNIKITLSKKNDLIFKIKWPKHRIYRTEYEIYRNAYFEERRNAFPLFSQLDMETQQPTAMPTAQHSFKQKSSGQESLKQKPPGQKFIYLLEEEFGHGDFDTVYKAVDVNTGDVYATKKFHHDD